MVRSPAKDEEMLVYAFKKGVLLGPFCEALIRAHPATFAEVRRLAVAHIANESEVAEKRGSVAPARPRAQIRIQPQRVLETAAAILMIQGRTRAGAQGALNQHVGSTIARRSISLSWGWQT